MNISVIMPVYNENTQELNQSIDSILDQTFKDFEFVIVDDNPRSNRIYNFLQIISHRDSRIKLIINSKSIGPSASVNKAAKVSDSDFIARMDADDICKKNRLQKQVIFLLRHNLDLVCSNFCGFTSMKSNIDQRGYYHIHTNIISQQRIKDLFSYYNIAMGPTLFFKRDSFLKIHGYRKMLSEDYDLAARFIINHFKVGYISSVLVFKRDRNNNLSNNKGLDEFVSSFLISKILRKSSFTKVVSLNKIHYMTKNISSKNFLKFHKFKQYYSKYKNDNTIVYLIKAILVTLSSFLILKRNVWMFYLKLKG